MKKKVILLISVIFIIMIFLGTTLGIFNYQKISNDGQVVLGEIYMKSTSKTGEVVINDMLPSSTYDPNNYYEFQITGKNTYTEKDIYYEIQLSHGNDSKIRTERIKDEFLKFRLVEVENGQEIELINNRSYMDLTKKRIYVDVIKKNTISEINKTYRLYVWVSDEILIGNISEADYDMDTWNNQIYANLNVTVNGDLYEKYVPNSQLAHINTTSGKFWPSEIENIKTSISEINFLNLNLEEMNSIKNTNTYLEENILNNKIYDLEDANAIGFIKVFLTEDSNNLGSYKMYVASEEDILYFPSDSSYMFSGFTNLVSINYQNIVINTSLVTDMRYMFNACSSLTNLDLSNFDTANVTDMRHMFDNCKNLASLNITSFDTASVTVMHYMFNNCNKLTKLEVGSFNTSEVTRLDYMFNYCNSLTSLDVSSFDTGKVTNMSYMFSGCSSLTSLDLSNFNTVNVTNMNYMFSGCTSLTRLDVSNFNTGKVTTMSYMFNACSSLTSLDLSNFNTSSVIYMNRMFYNTHNLQQLNVNSFITSQVTTMERMFDGLYQITELDLSSFDTTKVTNMDVMFGDMIKIETIYVSDKWTVANVTTSVEMFRSDAKLVGGNGTKYNSSYIDKTYARIDKSNTPGYLTYKVYPSSN